MLYSLFSALVRRLSKQVDDSISARINACFDWGQEDSRVNPRFYELGSGVPALVVVDMQKGFLCKDGSDEYYHDYYRDFVQSVEALVVDAVRKGWKVFLLEFEDYGPTLWQITRHLEGYPLAVRLSKSGRDGADNLLTVNDKSGGSPSYLVCGCYADQCVEATVVSLAQMQPRSLVQVARAACLPYEQDFTWTRFPTGPNLRFAEAA